MLKEEVRKLEIQNKVLFLGYQKNVYKYLLEIELSIPRLSCYDRLLSKGQSNFLFLVRGIGIILHKPSPLRI